MVAVPSHPPPEPSADSGEQRMLLHGVTWAEYCRLRELFDHRPSLRLTYLCGALEIMTTSPTHELMKTRIARLLEAWSDVRDVDLRGFGSTTFRNEAMERGLEPDECYTLGARTPVAEDIDRPDLAIEVVVSAPLLDNLSVYAGLAVPEVWVWRANTIHVFVLEGAAYREVETSRLLPDVDLALIAELALEPKQVDAVRALRARCGRG